MYNKYKLCIIMILLYSLFYYNESYNFILILYRLIRNLFSSNTPEYISPLYNNCSLDLLTNKITILISVKDTCTQGINLLSYLASILPYNISIIYVYPDFIGCNFIDIDIGIFTNLIVKKIESVGSPIQGFLESQSLIKTPYTLLMHNDAYPIDIESICELYRALETHSEAAFSVPQLYEKSENNIIVPHGHLQNLHIRQSHKNHLSINYEINMELLTRRKAYDFNINGYPQIDFMEDHAYMGRSDTFHLYLDKYASLTLEYLDSILSMRLNNTYPWYVPTSRFIFDVDINKLGWKDIPYFVNKRSEESGLNVCNYLTYKWDVQFPITGIWNYVRHSYLSNVVFNDNLLPNDRLNQAALYYSWFHSIGFNRYNNYTLNDILNYMSLPINDNILISRNINISNTLNSVKYNASNILPIKKHNKLLKIKLNSKYMGIEYKVSFNCNPSSCGMLVIHNNNCYCYTYVSPYNIKSSYGIISFLNKIKLPSRIYKFIQMKFIRNNNYNNNKNNYCENDSYCKFYIPAFSKNSRLIKWSWFI